MIRSSLFTHVFSVSALSLASAVVGCSSGDSASAPGPTDTGSFNDAITERPDDGVDSAKSDGGTDGGTDTSATGDVGGDTGTTTDVETDATDTATGDAGTFVEIAVGGTSFTFSPATANIKVGDTVRWTWKGPSHSVTSGTVSSGGIATADGKFDSSVLGAGATFIHKFDTAGTFPYYCAVHFSAGMKGSVVVAP